MPGWLQRLWAHTAARGMMETLGLTNKGGGTLKPKKPKDGDNNDVKLAEIDIVLKINNTRCSYFYLSSLRLTRGAFKVFCVEVGSV